MRDEPNAASPSSAAEPGLPRSNCLNLRLMLWLQLRNELWKLFGKQRTYIGSGMFFLAQSIGILLFQFGQGPYRQLVGDIERFGISAGPFCQQPDGGEFPVGADRLFSAPALRLSGGRGPGGQGIGGWDPANDFVPADFAVAAAAVEMAVGRGLLVHPGFVARLLQRPGRECVFSLRAAFLSFCRWTRSSATLMARWRGNGLRRCIFS